MAFHVPRRMGGEAIFEATQSHDSALPTAVFITSTRRRFTAHSFFQGYGSRKRTAENILLLTLQTIHVSWRLDSLRFLVSATWFCVVHVESHWTSVPSEEIGFHGKICKVC